MTGILAIELLGAIAGAAVALLFLPPKSRTEFARRFALSIIVGMIFADPVRVRLGQEAVWQNYLAGSAGVAMLGWFIIGAAIRVIGKWTPPKGE